MLKGIISFLIILALLTVAFVIGSQNEEVVTVNYLIAQANIRLSTLIAISLSIGVIVGILIMLASWLRLKVQLMSTQSTMQHLEKDH
ncbi:LapA family protein [Alteromonas sp. A081]|uniref:LapA family protein n=1 Tax=Alteromonas sp. A081 TaxID=3410269 RepID=UPI003B986823